MTAFERLGRFTYRRRWWVLAAWALLVLVAIPFAIYNRLVHLRNVGRESYRDIDTELKINAPAFVKQVQRLLDMSKEGTWPIDGMWFWNQ